METEEAPVPFVETAEVHRSQMDEHSTFKMAMPVEELADNAKEGFEPQEITNGDEEHGEEKDPFGAQPERMEADESNMYTEDNSHSQSKELPDSTSNDDITETKAKIESTTGEDTGIDDHRAEEHDEHGSTDFIKINNDKDISRLEEDEQAPDEMHEEDNVGTKDGMEMEAEIKEEVEKDNVTKVAPDTVKAEEKEVKEKASGKPEKKAAKPRKRKPKGGDGTTGPTRNPALCVPAAEVPTPKGWSRIVVQRITGASAGKYDVYYFSPFGKKLRSKNEVRNYCEQQNLVVDLDLFQFSHSLTPRRRGPKAAGAAAGQPAAKKPKAPAVGKKRKLAEGKSQGGKSNISGFKGRTGAAKGRGIAAKGKGIAAKGKGKDVASKGKVVAAKVKASVAKGKAAIKKGKAQVGASVKGKPAQGKKTAKQRAKPSKSKDAKVTKATSKKGKARNTRESQTRASKASQKVTVKFTFKAQKRQAGGQGQGSPNKRRK